MKNELKGKPEGKLSEKQRLDQDYGSKQNSVKRVIMVEGKDDDTCVIKKHRANLPGKKSSEEPSKELIEKDKSIVKDTGVIIEDTRPSTASKEEVTIDDLSKQSEKREVDQIKTDINPIVNQENITDVTKEDSIKAMELGEESVKVEAFEMVKENSDEIIQNKVFGG